MSAFFRLLGSASLAVAFLLAASHSAAAQTYTESVLYYFCSQMYCTDGAEPFAGVVQGSDGNFYGTTLGGGNLYGDEFEDYGTVFKVTPAGSFTSLYSFCSLGFCEDGDGPLAGLIQGSDGNFYGTTEGGGNRNNNDAGTVFKVTPTGSLTVLYSFCSRTKCTDGNAPQGGLVQGTDGNFYGTTLNGGTYNYGTVFRLTPTGSLTTLHSFCSQTNCPDGEYPRTALIQGTDGNLYGTAYYGGNANGVDPYGSGTVFKITVSGSFTTLYSFCSQTDCTDGVGPSGLVQGTDGNFYGTTGNGGIYDSTGAAATTAGTVFKLTPSGSLTTLYDFCSQTNCADGSGPSAGLLLGSDGHFYGTTFAGGNDYENVYGGDGTAFEITPSGSLTTLYAFCSQANCTDGYAPEAGVVQGADGNFYGTTSNGGTGTGVGGGYDGTVYKLAVSPGLKAPVQLGLSSKSLSAGSAFTLTYTVANAGSDTLQYCFATNTAGDTVWSGVKTGKTTLQNASLTAPSAYGTYTYALTCGGMESGFATLTVKDDTASSVTATPNPATVGQMVTLTATVAHSAGSAVPTGTVAFLVSGTAIGSGTLNSSGMATLSAGTNGFAPGNYPVMATYSGDGNYDSSASAATTVTLNKAPTATTLTASPNPVTPPLSVMLTATVKRSAAGAVGTPGGTVTFYYQSVALGTVGLSGSGMASVEASSEGLAAGKYPITAKYNGDASDVASSSAVTVTVK